MRKHQIVGANLRKRKRTTIRDQGAKVLCDLVARDFTATKPGQLYIGDITYLPCGTGEFMYLATVIDVCSRRLVGYSIADHMRTSLVQDAIKDAARTRGTLNGAIFHSGHGSVYTSSAFQSACRRLGIRQSMGRSGRVRITRWLKSFNASLKRETLQGAGGWASPTLCRREVFRWITRYNTRRRHLRDWLPVAAGFRTLDHGCYRGACCLIITPCPPHGGHPHCPRGRRRHRRPHNRAP